MTRDLPCLPPQVLLSTAPDATGATHWGQQVFFLNPPVAVAPGDWISCDVDFQRKKENHRLMKARHQQLLLSQVRFLMSCPR